MMWQYKNSALCFSELNMLQNEYDIDTDDFANIKETLQKINLFQMELLLISKERIYIH